MFSPVRRLALASAGCCALLAAPLLAQQAAPDGAGESVRSAPPSDAANPVPDVPLPAADDELFAPLPAIEDALSPIVVEPVPPPDPQLTQPLPPLSTFDLTPAEEFRPSGEADKIIHYTMSVEGAEPAGIMDSFNALSVLRKGRNNGATAAQIASRSNIDRALLERLLFSEGWYGARVSSHAETIADGTAAIAFTADIGERYHWREITLDLYPDAPQSLEEGFGLKVGDPVRAADVEEAEGALLVKMRREGYPFAEIGARDVVLDEAAPTATYYLTSDIGPRGRFGRIRMEGFKPFDEGHAEVIARFRRGDLYDADLVDDLRRALNQTQLFGGVTVVPVDSGERLDDGTAVTDIRVIGNRGPLKQLRGQIGYSSGQASTAEMGLPGGQILYGTGEGLRAEIGWRHRNLLSPEGAFMARGVVGTQEQRLASQLTFSNWNQRDRTLTASADVANLNQPAYKARAITLGASVSRLSTPIWQKRWTWSGGFELIASSEEDRSLEGDTGRETYLIAALPMMLGYDSSDDLLDPTKGYRATIRVSPEYSRNGGAGHTYVRLIGDASAYRQVMDSLVLAGRVRVGSIVGADRTDIAPTRRLYSGGGGSVRGFGFQDVGPAGADNRPLGGRGLLEASVETRYRFGDFGIVGFVDAGTLNQDPTPTLSDISVGVGVGVRYYTSFGPMRVDIARAINNRERAPVIGLYISIGQAF